MSTEENREIVRRFHHEIWGARNPAIADELCAADYTLRMSGMPEMRGAESMKQFASVFYAAFPDLGFSDDDVIAEEDRVAVRWTAWGTQTGPFATPNGALPPSGKSVRFSGIGIFRLAGGKIVEHDVVADQLTMLQQLGVIPG